MMKISQADDRPVKVLAYPGDDRRDPEPDDEDLTMSDIL